MALGTTPSLTEINTELGTTGQSLVTCIANAGKTGTWTKQTDFANYSAASITVTPSSATVLGFDTLYDITITASEAWEFSGLLPSWVSSINPNSGTATAGTSVRIRFSVNETGSSRSESLTFRLTAQTSITDSISLTQQSI